MESVSLAPHPPLRPSKNTLLPRVSPPTHGPSLGSCPLPGAGLPVPSAHTYHLSPGPAPPTNSVDNLHGGIPNCLLVSPLNSIGAAWGQGCAHVMSASPVPNTAQH